MKEKKNPIRNILAVFLGVAVLCVFIEVILQFSGSQDYDIWSKDTLSGLTTYRPNSQFVHSGTCFENMVEVNNIGLHGPVVSIPKGEDTFRILLVGSSFVEALQVQNNQMTSFVLEGKLNESSKGTVRYEVIPLGFSSNGTYLDALYYERYGKALKPDLVILLQTDYEVGVEPPVRYDENGEVIFAYDQTVQDSRIVFLKKQLRKSKMVMNVMDRAHLFVANAKEFLADPFRS